MAEILKLSLDDYYEEVNASGLYKGVRNLLNEIIVAYLGDGDYPSITEASFNNFISALLGGSRGLVAKESSKCSTDHLKDPRSIISVFFKSLRCFCGVANDNRSGGSWYNRLAFSIMIFLTDTTTTG